MPLTNIQQPEIVLINDTLRLKAYDESLDAIALKWYSNPNVMYPMCDDPHAQYDIVMIKKMYTYLNNLGEFYSIEIFEKGIWIPIGDVTFSDKDMPIVIGDPAYWGRGIGKAVIRTLLERALMLGMKELHIQSIYHHNERSRRLFTSVGFIKTGSEGNEDSFKLVLKE